MHPATPVAGEPPPAFRQRLQRPSDGRRQERFAAGDLHRPSRKSQKWAVAYIGTADEEDPDPTPGGDEEDPDPAPGGDEEDPDPAPGGDEEDPDPTPGGDEEDPDPTPGGDEEDPDPTPGDDESTGPAADTDAPEDSGSGTPADDAEDGCASSTGLGMLGLLCAAACGSLFARRRKH